MTMDESFNLSVPAHWINSRSFFYKIMTRETARIVLQNRTLRWSTPELLNDPYDLQFDFHIGIDPEKVKETALQKLWDAHYGDTPLSSQNRLGAFIQTVRDIFPKLSREEFDTEYGEAIEEGLSRVRKSLPEMQDNVRQLMATLKVLCLTEGIESPSIWSYYAESHQGVALRLKSIPQLDSVWGLAKPIQYVREMPKLIDNDFMASIISEPLAVLIRSVTERFVFTKSNEWAHEREWRIFGGVGRHPTAQYEDLKFHQDELDAVIFGCRMPDADRQSLTALVRATYPQATLLEAYKARDRFAIEVRPIEL